MSWHDTHYQSGTEPPASAPEHPRTEAIVGPPPLPTVIPAGGPESAGWFGHFRGLVVNHNPFYILSAVLVVYGLSLMFRSAGGASDPRALVGLTWGYTVLVALAAVVVIRLRVVWEDVRSLLLILLILLVANAISLDDLVLGQTGSQRLFTGLSLGVAITLCELVLRSGGIRLGALLRLPMHGLLALIYLYPLGLTSLLEEGRQNIGPIFWAMHLFALLVGLMLLTLLPAVDRGRSYSADNGTPYPWPWFPWLAFGLLALGTLVRLYTLCISFVPETGTTNPFGAYFALPVLSAGGLVVLHIGQRAKSRRITGFALALPLIAVVAACPVHLPDSAIYQEFLGLYLEKLASPILLALIAACVFYLYALLRGCRAALPLFFISLAVLSVVDPGTVNLGTLTAPQAWVLWILAASLTVLALARRTPGTIGAATVIGWLAFFVQCGELGVSPLVPATILGHVMLAASLAAGLLADGRLARILQGLAIAPLMVFVFAASFATLPPPDGVWHLHLPGWMPFVYLVVMAVVATVYAARAQNVYFTLVPIAIGIVLLTHGGILAWKWWGDWLRQAGAGVLIAGALCLVIGFGISLVKGLRRLGRLKWIPRTATWLASHFPDASLLSVRRSLRALTVFYVIFFFMFFAEVGRSQATERPSRDARAELETCPGRLVFLKQALELYQLEHDGKLPTGSAAALPEALAEYLRPDAFRCPQDSTETDGPAVLSYSYAQPQGEAQADPDRPILWDAAPRHAGGRQVVTMGGATTYLKERRWRELREKWNLKEGDE